MADLPLQSKLPERLREAIDRLTRATCSFAQHIDRDGVGWSSMRLDDVCAILGEVERLQRNESRLEVERDEALKLLTQYAREAGEATGRLEMSEAAGIVDGWRERAQTAEQALSASQKEVEAKTKALIAAEGWFRDYAQQHRAKGTADGNLKAQTNEDRADHLRSALQTGGREDA